MVILIKKLPNSKKNTLYTIATGVGGPGPKAGAPTAAGMVGATAVLGAGVAAPADSTTSALEHAATATATATATHNDSSAARSLVIQPA